jgi:hypothetical protein
MSSLAQEASFQLSAIQDPTVRAATESLMIDTILGFSKALVPGKEHVIDEFWGLVESGHDNEAIGDGSFLEMLVKLLELLLPLLLRILFPEGGASGASEVV